MDVLRGAIVWTVEVWEWRRGMGLLYELAYCDDALSVIRHIVYSLGALLFRRHHRHCCPAFSSLQIHLLYILVLATPNHRTLSCIFVFTNSFAAPWHSQPSLMPASLPFEYHLTTKRICDTIWLGFIHIVLFEHPLNVDVCLLLLLPIGCTNVPSMVHYWCIPACMSGVQLVLCSCTRYTIITC